MWLDEGAVGGKNLPKSDSDYLHEFHLDTQNPLGRSRCLGFKGPTSTVVTPIKRHLTRRGAREEITLREKKSHGGT